MFAYCKNNAVNMHDNDGERPDFGDGTGRETNEEREASLAYQKIVAAQNIERYSGSSSATSTLPTRILSTAVAIVNSKPGQAAGSLADNAIGNIIVEAAQKNAAEAWHPIPLPTLAMYKMPGESSFLQGCKSIVKKGGGIFAAVSLGLNAWDDFHNYGLIKGGQRFGVDLLSAAVGTGIGLLTAEVPGGIILGTAVSMYINDKYFDPWKESIK